MEEETKKPFYRKIPGFRSGKGWKMGVATFFYAFVLMVVVIAILDPPTEDPATAAKSSNQQQREKGSATTEPSLQPEPEPEKTPEEIYEEEYQVWIEGQFSAWDGAHHDLVRLVKNNMNDQGSFEHVETKYLRIQTQEHINTVGNGADIDDVYLYMKFRGANAFGGKILSEVEALVDKSAGTIMIISDGF